jgi:hypothetical protein
MTRAIDHLRTLLGMQFEQLAGAHVSGELPLSDTVVNRAVAERLGSSAHVQAVHVHARDGDAVDVHLTLRGVPMISSVPVSLRIARQPLLPTSPVLEMEWSLAGLGALARIAGPFVTRMAKLPPGVRIDRDRIAIDLEEVLQAQGLADVLRLITRLEVHTRDGRIVLDFALAGPPSAEPAPRT